MRMTLIENNIELKGFLAYFIHMAPCWHATSYFERICT
jgi:hypothetical protein